MFSLFRPLAFSFLFLLFVQVPLPAQWMGRVFVDSNENGVYDKGELLLQDAVVSNGLHITRSGSDGTYELPAWEKARFVTLYSGPHFYTLTRFHRIIKGRGEYHFPVRLKDKKETTTFLHVSDTETYEAKEWYNDLRAYIRNHKPDFLVHTGDICYRSGLNWHAKRAQSVDLGIPSYYCLGNHDLIEGAYGEQYFEEKFGPAWYAFEEGNTLFVITPMMSGDYKPGFTREEIGTWLKNLVATYPKTQPKYFFNHDLLAQSEHFSFHINETDSVYLNDYNLKAWVYGHWHNNTYMRHGESGIQSFCVSPAAKGGIDHSPSSIRIFKVDENGDSQSKLRWTFVDKTIKIVSPLKNKIYKNEAGEIRLLVNVYDTENEVDSVKFAVYGAEGFNWKSSLPEGVWKDMRPVSDWAWAAAYTLEEDSEHEVVVYAYLHNGEILQDKAVFHTEDKQSTDQRFNLAWAQNAGGNVFMGSPLVDRGHIVTSVFDDGDGEEAYIICLDEKSGSVRWKYPTKNSIKNQMVLVDGKVVGTDVQGYTYAIDLETGSLQWEVDLQYHRLAGFVSGIAADDQYIYTGFGKSLMALDAENGEVKWINQAWQGGEGSTPSMVIANNLLIASSNWRALYAHNKETGELIWSRKDAGLRFRDGTVGSFNQSLWVAQDSAGVGLLRALDMQSGSTIQSFPTGISNRSTSAPVFAEGKIIVAGSHPGIIAMDTNGKQLWKTEVEPALFYTPQYYSDRQRTIESTPLVIDQSLVFGAMDGYLYSVNITTGYIEQKVYLGAPILGNAARTQNGFVVSDFAGNVYNFKWRD